MRGRSDWHMFYEMGLDPIDDDHLVYTVVRTQGPGRLESSCRDLSR